MKRRAGLVVAAALSVASAPAGAARRDPPPPTLAELDARDLQAGTAGLSADAGQAAAGYEAFLAIAGTAPPLRAQALRRLGDLRLEQADSLGDDADEAASRRSAQLAATAYRQLLAEQPGYAAADAVLYQLARALERLGEEQAALDTLAQLAERYPRSGHYAEARFRRGEAAFSAQRYGEAELSYRDVLGADPRSEFAQQARYKLAWSLFKQGRDAGSADEFLNLLDGLLLAEGALRSEAALSRPERELADDALRAIALMCAATDGPAAVAAALERHGAVAYEARLYAALGDLYVEKERFQDAADAYQAFALRQPMDPAAPLLLVRATDAYARGGFMALVLDGKRRLVEAYGPGSAYWTGRGGALDPALLLALQDQLLDLARHHHALAQRDSDAAERDLAVGWYRRYLAGFDATPQAAPTRLLLADLLFEGRRYGEAAVEYERVAYGYGNGAGSAAAAYAAVVAYAEAERNAPAADLAELHQAATAASLRFADEFPDHRETPAVLTRVAKAVFDDGDTQQAVAVARRILALGTRADADQQRVAWTIVAHAAFDAGHYADAERAYAALLERLPSADKQREETVERLAASVYRQAEALRAAGDARGAITGFLRVATVAPDSPTRPVAEFDAATLLLAREDWGDAATVLERFRVEHPGHELQAEVTRKLAFAYLEGGRVRQAAAEYERIAATATEPAEARRAALWQAAELHAAAGDPSAARRAYGAYVAQFPLPVAPAIEARHELAELAASSGDGRERERWLVELVAADAAAGSDRTDRTRLLAAQASLELARPLDTAARAARLVAPLERSLRARKQALEAALAAYGRAADYGIAPVTAAAGYAMAELYRDLGRALLASERPRDLGPEELEQYELLLEEQAFPFEERAIALHERNARLASEGFYDASVRGSYAALAELAPGRYLRPERDGGTPAVAADEAEIAAALVAAPADAMLLNRLGIAHRRAGRFEQARSAYLQAIAAAPTLPDAQCNLGILLDLYVDDPAAALPYYERCAALAPADGEHVAAWLVELRARLDLVQRTAETTP